MKMASQLVEELQRKIEKEGDRPVVTFEGDDYESSTPVVLTETLIANGGHYIWPTYTGQEGKRRKVFVL